MADKSLEDNINIELTKRDAQEYAYRHGLPDDIPIVIVVPSCKCGKGLDDSTQDLKCPICGALGIEEQA
jgi:hypothetical protein